MDKTFRFVTWLYARLLRLYPRKHQMQFGEEQAGVFRQAALDAEKRGGLALISLLFRELAHLPGILLRGYLPAVKIVFKQQGDRWELAAALFAFSLPLLSELSLAQFHWLIIAWLALTGLILIVAVFNGLPRWSIPYAGLIHAIVFLLLLNTTLLSSNHSLLARLYRWWYPSSLWERLSYQMVLDGIFAILQIGLIGSIVAVLWLVTRLVKLPRRWRFERDWTMFSFLFYSGNTVGLLITFDEYHYQGTTVAIAVLFLALGAWGYLRADYPARRILALLVGTALSCCAIAAGKWVILPLQNWPWLLLDHPLETERWFETLSALIGLPWMAILILIPAFIPLPRFIRAGTFS